MKFKSFIVLLFVSFAPPIQAAHIIKIGIGLDQQVGVNADYDSGTKTIVWSGGQDGWLLSDDMSAFVYFSELPDFDSVVATATYTGMTDNSSGGQAAASFSSGTWSIALNANGSNVMYLAGHISGKYNETEIDNTNKLDGRAVVKVDTATFVDAYWKTTDVGVIGLNDSLFGMIADITLPYEPAFDSYLLQDYSSANAVVTLTIPEPATITFFASLGIFAVIRKRHWINTKV